MSDYERIASAIEYIVANAPSQPGLAEVAAAVNLSASHFQRLFTRWAGLTPKRFLQVITVERAKRLLEETSLPLLAASETLGLSSQSRLHEHFVTLEAVTPAEYRRRGRAVSMHYGRGQSPFGTAWLAFSDRGISALAFADAASTRVPDSVTGAWPEARWERSDDEAAAWLERIFQRPISASGDAPFRVCVSGTNFQVAVWRALLAIPPGGLVSYGDVASAVGRPRAVRAVGAAVGANPCAWLIPCHRVIRATGEVGGYRWGVVRKHAIHVWEAAAADGMLPEC